MVKATGSPEPEGVNALVRILRDRSARIDERDDAAIDLGKSDDDRALAALVEIASRADDDTILGSAGESLAQIAIRRGKFDSSWLDRLAPPARRELVASLRAEAPQLLGKGPPPGDASA